MATDYFVPTFEVLANGARLAADVSAYVTQVSVTLEISTTDQFDLTLANPYPDLPWTHTDDADLFAEGTNIAIRIGYERDLQTMVSGEITGIRPAFPASGPPTVQISGHSRMSRLQEKPKTRPFVNRTDREIAALVASETHLTLVADDATGAAAQGQNRYVMQHNQTDLAFLIDLARRGNYELRVEGDKLIFRQWQRRTTADYALIWGGQPVAAPAGVPAVPLRSFTPTFNAQKQIDRVIVSGKHPIIGHAGKPPASAAVSQPSTSPQPAEREYRVATAPVGSREEADRLAKSIYDDFRRKAITGSGTTVGLPDLRPGVDVEILGVGPRFSGRYTVTRAVHSIGSGGFETSFNVERSIAP